MNQRAARANRGNHVAVRPGKSLSCANARSPHVSSRSSASAGSDAEMLLRKLRERLVDHSAALGRAGIGVDFIERIEPQHVPRVD